MNSGDVLLAGVFFVLAIIVQCVGVLIADYTNHLRQLKRLKIEHDNKVDYLAAETFFKKKLEYFEKMSNLFEDYILNYSQLFFMINPQEVIMSANLPEIGELRNKNILKEKISEILKNLEENQLTNLLPKGHSLYMASEVIPTLISPFVLNHARLFTLTAEYLRGDLKDQKLKQEINQLINQNIVNGSTIVEELKRDLLIIKKPQLNKKFPNPVLKKPFS